MRKCKRKIAMLILATIICGNVSVIQANASTLGNSTNAMQSELEKVSLKNETISKEIEVDIENNEGVQSSRGAEHNPSNYTLVTPYNPIGTIKTSFKGEYYDFNFKNIIEDPKNPSRVLIQTEEKSRSSFIYNFYTTVEVYKKVGNNLKLATKQKIKLSNMSQIHELNLSKAGLKDQPYIYIRLCKQTSRGEITGTKMFKIKNEPNDWGANWASSYIRKAMDLGWINKCQTFRPEANITRAEFIKIVNRAFGFNSHGSESFTDVSPNDWFYNEVRKATKAGYISTKTNKFRPEAPITREEVATIITNIMNNKDNNLDKIRRFSDFNQISDWARSSVEGVVEAGYMGKGSNKFRPTSKISRAEAIVTLGRIKKIV